MCIRDRTIGACRPVRSTGPEGVDRGVVSATVTTKRGLVRSCLLYTSDAADERSSVDLGGRRIIKKKKHSTPPTGRCIYIKIDTKTRLAQTSGNA